MNQVDQTRQSVHIWFSVDNVGIYFYCIWIYNVSGIPFHKSYYNIPTGLYPDWKINKYNSRRIYADLLVDEWMIFLDFLNMPDYNFLAYYLGRVLRRDPLDWYINVFLVTQNGV